MVIVDIKNAGPSKDVHCHVPTKNACFEKLPIWGFVVCIGVFRCFPTVWPAPSAPWHGEFQASEGDSDSFLSPIFEEVSLDAQTFVQALL